MIYAAELCTQCRFIGLEYNVELVKEARRRVLEAGLQKRVEIVHADATTYDFVKDATAIFIYLVPEGIRYVYFPSFRDSFVCRVGHVQNSHKHLQNSHKQSFQTLEFVRFRLTHRHINSRLSSVLRRGCRVVSYIFSIPNHEPVEVVEAKGGLKIRLYFSSDSGMKTPVSTPPEKQ